MPHSIDPTCTFLIRIDTLDTMTNKLYVAGYAVLNAFVKPGTKQPLLKAEQVCRSCRWSSLVHTQPPADVAVLDFCERRTFA